MLSGIRNKYLILEGENLEAFPSRSAVRLTTTHAKKNLIVEAVAEAVKSIEKRRLALGDLYPASRRGPPRTEPHIQLINFKEVKTQGRRHPLLLVPTDKIRS